MDIEVMKKELNEYFEYIKAIYINEFSKYMTNETKERIKNLENIIELNEELQFKVTCLKKIVFNLDLRSYIEENDLKNENNLSDLSESSRNYIKYLIENEDNVYNIIKNKILKQIIILFINNNDVLSLGVAELIEEILIKKYKLPHEEFIESKEKEVAIYLRNIVGEDILLAAIINDNQKLIESNYNIYTKDDNSYQKLMKELNKIYQNYNKKIGKVYFTDSLYEYDKLDYNIGEKTQNLQEEKLNNDMIKLKRLSTIKQCLVNICNHKFLFTALELKELESLLYLINEILNRTMKDGKEAILINIEKEYEKILELENDCAKFIQKIWKNTLTEPSKYEIGRDFSFLIGQNNDIINATYITGEHLKHIKTYKNTYGLIFEPTIGSIAYTSTSKVELKKINDDSYMPNSNTIYINKKPFEINNQSDSKLMTPNMILKNNINKKVVKNNIILDPSKVRITGIYCFVDEDLENNSNYNKALELAEMYNLPIVPINKDLYTIAAPKLEIEIEEITNSSIEYELNEQMKTI